MTRPQWVSLTEYATREGITRAGAWRRMRRVQKVFPKASPVRKLGRTLEVNLSALARLGDSGRDPDLRERVRRLEESITSLRCRVASLELRADPVRKKVTIQR